MSDFEPRYSSRAAVLAAGISTDTFKNWISRQPSAILLQADERERHGRGHPLLFSVVRVTQLALTARLVWLGWAPREASLAAAAFTDISDGDPREGQPRRSPGELFASGITLLVADRLGPTARCVQALPDTPWSNLFDFNFGMTVPPDQICVVNVNHVFHHVREVLVSTEQ